MDSLINTSAGEEKVKFFVYFFFYIFFNLIIWLGKDDDLYARANYKFGKVIKLNPDIARYYMHNHEQDKANEDR